jgi:ABC-type amino acid transport substrate-binding protein
MKTSLHLLAAAALAACLGTAAAAPVAVTGDIHSVANAFAVDASAFDRGDDPDIDAATTIAHVSLVDLAAGPYDYFRLDLGQGGALTLDIDYSDGWDHAGLALDLQVAVWGADGTLLALDDDDPRPWGFPDPSADAGSFSVLDPYLHLDGLAAGSYVIGLGYSGAQAGASGWLPGAEIPAGGMYELNVSFAPVPEPTAGLLWLAGALPLLAGFVRRRRHRGRA